MRNFGLAACASLAMLAAGQLAAQTDEGGQGRLIFLGADPAEGRPGPVGEGLDVLAFEGLPAEGEAEIEVLAALLRANPVSTFVTTPDASRIETGELSLVIDLALSSGQGGHRVSVGGTDMPAAELSARLSALANAFNPTERQLSFVRVSDPEDLLPQTLEGLRGALTTAGFGMSVLMVDPADPACRGQRLPLHYGVLGGVADRVPFGDGDGKTTGAEAAAWITAALERDVDRGHGCAARYSVILRGDDDPGRVLATTGDLPLIPAMESAVYMENFESLFLLPSEDPGPIREYLSSCTYCPNEGELTARLQTIGERELALGLETEVWQSIRDDASPVRLRVYLENCQLCAYREEAEGLILVLDAAAAARDDENAAFSVLSEARDLPGLREWVEGCVACDFKDEAMDLIEEIEADGRFAAEQAALESAISRNNADEIAAWLETCEICSGRADAEDMLAILREQVEVAQPCLAAAGLPQQGGPRLLSEIDVPAARAACDGALATTPGNPLAISTLGRVAQAGGDIAAARAAYQVGIEAGLPSAFGLAAHSHYAPGDGGLADYALAEELALQGYEGGDWLSGEVLAVLYSRELVAGKGAEEAYEVALAHAEEGNPVSQFFVGYFHRIGAGVEASDSEAADWFARAADQGYLHANSFLAEILETGSAEVPADPVRAAALYWAALEGGDGTARERLTNQIEDRPPEVVLEIQTRLREAGVFNGRIDGIGGINTARAVDQFANALAEGQASP